ncbi:right-handed parallel beta-helix repeat-containing protein [Arenibacter sp. M-2]|uniref:right-handed parallel beta-helix repeat-containing protein n=1 Tax=Arenibacter sp. M-2 TaxID=3053612 RepID=UPI00256FDCF6|nr:right-handed parallel beta-helix repeat-containing protein [Arenibacter sp. M-2]MDL5514939.1 right-handed parallel beta-helix repeat-containing protein [Arenibacter sp. M-2]
MKYFQIKLILSILLLSFAACQTDDDYGAFTPEKEDISLSATEQTVGKVAGDHSITVNSNLPWRAESNTSWISLKTLQGDAGSTTLEYSVENNITVETRQGSLDVWITQNNRVTLNISQEAGDLPPDTAQHIYVKPNGTGDGTNWDNATTLAHALTMDIFDDDKIHLASGTHIPVYTFGGITGSDDNEITFDIFRNIELIGGYSANPTEGETPDASINETILSGLLDNGTQVNHVVSITAAKVDGKSVKLSGLTIRDGNANGSGNNSVNGINYPKSYAGGVIIANGRLEINNCIITDNKVTGHGIGMYVFSGAELIMNNSKITGNQGTRSNGGGIYLNGGIATLSYTSIENNVTSGVGGAIQTYGSSILRMYNCTVANNTAGSRGAGVYARNNTQALLVNCTVYGNTTTAAPGLGAAVHTHDNSTIDIVSSTITANTGGNGGGINNTAGCTINLYNSIIAGNIGDGAASDIVGDVGYEYSIIGSDVFGEDGVQLTGEVFDASTMLEAMADNGGNTQTCKLVGDGNPARTNGMNVTQLQVLGINFSPAVPDDFSTNDQIGKDRAGNTVMGALID